MNFQEILPSRQLISLGSLGVPLLSCTSAYSLKHEAPFIDIMGSINEIYSALPLLGFSSCSPRLHVPSFISMKMGFL